MEDTNSPEQDERRRLMRIETAVEIVFSNYTTSGPLRAGVATDRSAGGMGILAPAAEPKGSELAIEFPPSAGDPESETTFLRGIVMHVSRTEDGEYFMGIRLSDSIRRRGPAAGGGQSHKGRVITKGLRPSSERHGLGADSPPSTMSSSTVTQQLMRDGAVARDGRSTFSWRRVVLAMLLLALFGLLLGRSVQEGSRRGGAGNGLAGLRSPLDVLPEPVEAAHDSEYSDRVLLSFLNLQEHFDSVGDASSLTRELESVNPAAVLSAGEWAQDDALLEHVRRDPESNPTQRLMAAVFHAQAFSAEGERELALAVLQQMTRAEMDAVSEPWRDAAARLRSLISENKGVASTFGPMDELFTLESNPGSSPGEEPLRIDVNTTTYVLSVVRSNQVLRSYPVGLGRDGSTPLGEYRIANKIRDPDWFHRGRTVRSGDPDNPLGASWMGLGRGEGATSYGIHPTEERASIRNDESAGCIRMWPQHAEEVFRVCPVGTPVFIHT